MAENTDATIITYQGTQVSCYGTLEETSNFDVVCDDEYDDDTWPNGHPVTGKPFTSWQEVVESLCGYYESEILEISAV